MKLVAAALLIFSGAAALGQTSFDEYFAANKRRQVGAREAAFAEACGVKRSEAQIVYGLSTELEGYKLHRTPGLLKGREEAQTDFFGSAEEWKLDGKPRLINVWTLVMDEGAESNELFCLDERGNVTLQESLSALDGEVSGTTGWIYVQRVSWDAARKQRLVRGGYVHKDGSPAVAPKLSREEAAESKDSAGKDLARDVIAALAR